MDRKRRSLITPTIIAGLALVAILVFRGPLVSWFSGKPLDGSAGQPVTAHAGPFTIEARLAPDPPQEKNQGLILVIRDGTGPVEHAKVNVVYDMPAMGVMAEMKGGAKITATEGGKYLAQFDLPMSSSWTLRATVHADSGSASQSFQMTVGTVGLTLAAGDGATGARTNQGALPPVEYPPIALDAIRSAMDAYGRARAKLARDDTQSVGTDARTIAEAMRAAHDALPKERRDLVDATTTAGEAAEHLEAAGTLADARKGFAILSTSFLPLAGADSRLSAGWHVFECPMFEGHPRWIQRPEHPDNPYMGTQMPSCGTATSWQTPTQSETSGPSSAGEIDHYTCSMHPSVKQATPGTCPICGMNLVPVTKEQQQEGIVMIDDVRRQLIGVRTEPVVSAPMRDSFRAVGHVAYDESTLADVNLKVHGWITKLFVSETGQRVARGQPLFTMYSPELYNAEQDFLLSLKGAAASAPTTEVGSARPELFARASRQRLHLLGLTDAQIDTIAQSGKPSEDVAIPSPANGFVIEKNVVEGASVDPGMRLYRIAALTKVWVEADVYETDLGHVRVGQHGNVTLDYLPGRAYDAKVAYIYPYLDPATRTGRVRLELANKDLDLRPGMYASVELSTDLGSRVQVPTAAVVYTGPRRLVFVDLGNGRFRPTEVQLGTESNGMYEVLSGLAAGDAVATSGVFLIAAEARITTAAKYWDSTPETPPAADSPPAAESMPASATASATLAMPLPSVPRSMPRPPPPKASSSVPAAAPMGVDYTCPMHPEVHSPVPGKCPKCGMDLVPAKAQP